MVAAPLREHLLDGEVHTEERRQPIEVELLGVQMDMDRRPVADVELASIRREQVPQDLDRVRNGVKLNRRLEYILGVVLPTKAAVFVIDPRKRDGAPDRFILRKLITLDFDLQPDFASHHLLIKDRRDVEAGCLAVTSSNKNGIHFFLLMRF